MRTKTKRTIKIEIAENTIPLDEALDKLAKAIARQMYQEEQRGKQKERS